MKTLGEILNLSTQYLEKHQIKNARRQAEDLISDALGMKRLNLYLEFDRPLVDAELENCRKYLARRAQGEPLQYIKGEVEFYDCRIQVTKDVLIPRQETEILVDRIIQELKKEDLKGKSLWDVCCGSGCIGIAIKKQFPQLKVILSDISKEALAIAQKNAQLNQVEVELLQGDRLSAFGTLKTHYLVCNPPYISEEEFKNLDVEVREFEPRLALVSGSSGLEFYTYLAQNLKKILHYPAKVWLEIGYTQGSAILSLFNENGWENGKIGKDWAGKDRFFFLEKESFFEYP